MEPPDPQGSAYEDLQGTQTNPGSTGAVFAWSRWKHFCGTVLPEVFDDMQAVQNMPAQPLTGVMT